jgi:hypothetical protein
MTIEDSSFISTPGENYYIFAGGTKPYHAGHNQLIESIIEDAAKDPSGNGKAVIFVGLGSRPPVMSKQVLHVWQTYIEPYLSVKASSLGVPLHIEYGGGPIGKVLALLKEAGEKCSLTGNVDNQFFIYSDPEDTEHNYLTPKFSKRTGEELKSSPPRYYASLTDHDPCPVNFMSVVDPSRFTRGEGTPNISGTAMREAIVAGNFQKFAEGLPIWMDSIASDIYELYKSNVTTNESLVLKNYFSRFMGYKG